MNNSDRNSVRERMAIWIPGGIGNGNFSQGYPMLEKLITGIETQFDVIVYSVVPPNRGFKTKLQLKYPPRYISWNFVRWSMLIFMFLIDHFEKRFSILMAFWAYPTAILFTLFKKVMRVKTVLSFLGGDSAGIPSIEYGIFHKPFKRKLALWSYQKADLLLTISEFQKNKLRSFGLSKPMITIPWGADASMYRFKWRRREAPIRFIHVGHINPVKDQTTLLKAFKIISDQTPSTLRIFGLDTLDGRMSRLANELQISDKVIFNEMVPYAEMPTHFYNADIMLHTSLSEAQCMALTEAAATGVLMAGTDVGILHDLGEECGIVVEVGDFESLASKVLSVIHNQEEWERKVNNAKAWSETHDLQWTIHSIITHIRSL